MRMDRSVAILGAAMALGAVAGIVAPTAAADCNDSSGTTVCAQGDIRGTHGPPPALPSLGPYGTWCNGAVCFPGSGFGIVLGP